MNKSNNIFLFSKTPFRDVKHIPILSTSYLQPFIDFSKYDYIIASSKEVFSALDKIGSWKHLPVLAVSESTADAARAEGVELLDVAKGYGKEMITLIKEKYADLRALYPHAEVVAFDIEHALKDIGVDVNSFIVYKTSCSQLEAVKLPQDAVCIFTSPSSVKCFEKVYTFLPSYQVVCIGETTRAALPEGVQAHISEKTSIQSAVERAKSLLK